MEKTLETALRNEAISIDCEIRRLTRHREAIRTLLSEDMLTGIEPETADQKPVLVVKKKNKKPKQIIVKHPKPEASGLPKFSQVLKNIFVSKPDIPFTSKVLALIMTKEIEAGRCNPSKKDMTSAVSAYIWNFSQRGLVKKSGKGYIWAGGKIVFKKQDKIEVPDDLDVLDEAIIEIVKRTDGITQDAVIHDVRISSHYGEIAKNLNGSLASEIDKRLAHLNVKDIVLSKDNKLSINPKADV